LSPWVTLWIQNWGPFPWAKPDIYHCYSLIEFYIFKSNFGVNGYAVIGSDQMKPIPQLTPTTDQYFWRYIRQMLTSGELEYQSICYDRA
jgi:hypothetical protein